MVNLLLGLRPAIMGIGATGGSRKSLLAMYQGIDNRYQYYAISKMNHPDSIKQVVYGYYLVEKHGRLIYEACDDGSLKMLYNEA